jgi:hypothetical protein
LNKGQIVAEGPSREVVEQYLSTLFVPVDNMNLRDAPERSGDGRLRFAAAYFQSQDGKRISMPISGHPVDIVLEFSNKKSLLNTAFVMTIYNQMGVAVTNFDVKLTGMAFQIPKGEWKAICHIPKLPLPIGNYKISIGAFDDIGKLDHVSTACIFDIETSNFYKNNCTPPMRFSTALVDHDWELISKTNS